MTTTKEELKAIRKEAVAGDFALLKMFRDCTIKNYNNHVPVMDIKIWNDTFTLEVNKFKPAGASIVVTEAWNGKEYKMAFTHQPVLVPDYDRMKTFFQTLLFHNLDSQIMDNLTAKADGFVISIHDAFLCAPGNAGKLRKEYAVQLKEIHTNRHKILSDFRTSIGATDIKADIAFMNLYNAVEQVPEDTVFNATAMK